MNLQKTSNKKKQNLSSESQDFTLDILQKQASLYLNRFRL